MSWDQPDLWGVKPTPAADTHRMISPLPSKAPAWASCWTDCALCLPELHGQQHINRNYRVYRICQPRGKCFKDSYCCDRQVAVTPVQTPSTPTSGWEDY